MIFKPKDVPRYGKVWANYHAQHERKGRRIGFALPRLLTVCLLVIGILCIV